MNGGQTLTAPQLARSIVEHGADAMAELRAEHAACVARQQELEKWIGWLDQVQQRTAPMIPNPGTMEEKA